MTLLKVSFMDDMKAGRGSKKTGAFRARVEVSNNNNNNC